MNYAVIVDGIVINTLVAESKESAELATGETCVLFTDDTPAYIGGTYDGTDFIPPSPYPSWILSSEKTWVAPTDLPNDEVPYVWNEETTSWVLYTQS